jgi:hypothetical protein
LVAVLLFTGHWNIAGDVVERWLRQLLVGLALQREGENAERGGSMVSSS